MSAFSQFAGIPATRSIVNGFSSGGSVTAGSIAASVVNNMAREVLSGALTANTLATVLSVSGAGYVPHLTVYTKDTTSRTVRIQVVVDGTTVFDATSSATTTSGAGMVVVGSGTSSGNTISDFPLSFGSTLVVKIASSLSETDKVAIGYIMQTR